MGRLRGVDGVRALAALSVVAHHVAVRTPETVPDSISAVVSQLWLGVVAFFVLSGFLLYKPFVRATLGSSRWPSLRTYFLARALRILPAYWIALSTIILVYYHSVLVALVWVVLAGMLVARRSRLLGTMLSASASAVLVALMVSAPHLFANTAWPLLRQYLLLQDVTGEVIGPAWTLQVEAAFYIALPGIAAMLHAVARRASAGTVRTACLLLILGALGAAATGYQALCASSFSLAVLLPGYLALFAAGMLLAVLAETSAFDPSSRIWPLTGIAACSAAVLLRNFGPTIAYQGGGFGPLYRPLMALGFALIIGHAILATRTSRLGRVVRAHVPEQIGLVSYAIYLWHDPIVLGLLHRGVFTISLLFNVVIAASIALTIATASWVLVERRFLERKRRYARRPEQIHTDSTSGQSRPAVPVPSPAT